MGPPPPLPSAAARSCPLLPAPARCRPLSPSASIPFFRPIFVLLFFVLSTPFRCPKGAKRAPKELQNGPPGRPLGDFSRNRATLLPTHKLQRFSYILRVNGDPFSDNLLPKRVPGTALEKNAVAGPLFDDFVSKTSQNEPPEEGGESPKCRPFSHSVPFWAPGSPRVAPR